MSLVDQITSLATRIATEFKAVRAQKAPLPEATLTARTTALGTPANLLGYTNRYALTAATTQALPPVTDGAVLAFALTAASTASLTLSASGTDVFGDGTSTTAVLAPGDLYFARGQIVSGVGRWRRLTGPLYSEQDTHNDVRYSLAVRYAVNIKDFGAAGDGTTDDSTARDAALANAISTGRKLLYLPPGSYLFTTQLAVTDTNVTIVGAGRTRTTIVAGSAIGTSEVIRAAASATGFEVTDLAITATASNNHSAIRVLAPDGRVERVRITGSGSGSVGALRGIYGETTATGLVVRQCRVTGAINTDSTFGTGCGIVVGGDDTLVDACTVSGCGTTFYNQQAGIVATGVTGSTGRRITIARCHSSGNGTHGVYATGCDDLNIYAGAFHDNGAVATASGGVGGANFGRGISIGGNAAVGPRVTNCALYNNQEDGLIITGGSAGTGPSDSSQVTDAIVTGNHAYNNNLGGFAGGHGIEVNAHGATITGNICHGNHNGISCSGVRLVITGNRSYRNTSTDTTQGAGIQVNFVTGTATISAATTSGSTAITASTTGGFAAVFPGQQITGTGIATSTSVASVNGDTITLSAAATATGTANLTFTTINMQCVITGNLCSYNDNYGIRTVSNGVYQGLLVTDNVLDGNGLVGRSGATYDLFIDANARTGVYRNNLTFSPSVRLSINDPSPNRGGNQTVSDNGLGRTLTYGTTVTWNGEISEVGRLTVTDTAAFTISPPAIAFQGRRVTYEILNSSGGTMGAITWTSGTNGFKLGGTFTNPANTFRRSITFIYQGTFWIEVGRTTADM